MLGKLKNRVLRKKKEHDGEVVVESRQADALREKIERYTEAVTFAEAGLQEQARELIRAEIEEKAKVLVVGNEDTFSKQVVDYAVGFAERMGYEIVALNVSPVRTESSKLAPFCDLLCEQFKAKSEEGVAGFRQVCKEKGIPFSQVIKFGDVDECIKESHEELRRVEFVIAEPESCPAEGKVAIPVFCLAR